MVVAPLLRLNKAWSRGIEGIQTTGRFRPRLLVLEVHDIPGGLLGDCSHSEQTITVGRNGPMGIVLCSTSREWCNRCRTIEVTLPFCGRVDFVIGTVVPPTVEGHPISDDNESFVVCRWPCDGVTPIDVGFGEGLWGPGPLTTDLVSGPVLSSTPTEHHGIITVGFGDSERTGGCEDNQDQQECQDESEEFLTHCFASIPIHCRD